MVTGICLYPLAPWLQPMGKLLDSFYSLLGMSRGVAASTSEALGFIWGSLYYLPQALNWRNANEIRNPRLLGVISHLVLACASLPCALIFLGILSGLRRHRDIEGFELYLHALAASGFLGAWVCCWGALFIASKNYRNKGYK